MNTKRQKVCFFNSGKSWGGGEKWHLEMAEGLNKKGYDVLVCGNTTGILHKKAQEAGLEGKSFRITNLSFLNPYKLFKVYCFFKSEHIDVVILNLSCDLKIGGIAAKLAGINKVIYRRGSAIPIKNSISNRYIFKHLVDFIIANSEATKSTILENNSSLFPDEKIVVLYNGIKVTEFNNIKPQDEGSKDVFTIGSVGRLEFEKNHKVLIELMPYLNQEFGNVRLIIGGKGSQEENLRKLSRNLGVDHYVDLVGFVEDVNSFMGSLDLFVLPSLWEGFGYVLVEAMACGKPVVAYNTGSIPEIVLDNLTGCLVPLNDTKALRKTISHLIRDKVRLHEMGNGGRLRAVKTFDIEVSTKKLMQILDSI